MAVTKCHKAELRQLHACLHNRQCAMHILEGTMLLAQLSFLLSVSLRCTSGWHHFESSIGKVSNACVTCSIATHCLLRVQL